MERISVNLSQAPRLSQNRHISQKTKGHGSFHPWPSEPIHATGVTLPVASDVELLRGCSGQARQRQEYQSQRQHPRRE